MDKFEYYRRAIRSGAYRHPKWVFSVFGVVQHISQDGVDEPEFPYQVVLSGDKKQLWYFDPESNRWDILCDYDPQKPVLNYPDKLTIGPETLTSIKIPTEVTAGNCLLNAILIEYPFKGKMAYRAGKFKPSEIVAEIVERVQDDPEPGEEEKPDTLYVREFIEFQNAATYLEMFAPITTVGLTEKSMEIDPKVIELRDKLLKQHAHELNDLAVLASIEKQCVDLDLQLRKGDISEKLLISGKSVDVERKRLHIMYGLEAGFGVENIITTSLMEGFQLKDMPAIANSIRSGSYNRGIETANGGVEVKRAERAFRAVRIRTDVDCGSRKGIIWNVLSSEEIAGRYIIEAGKSSLITEESAKAYIGKKILLRTPARCVLSENGKLEYCHVCAGEKMSARPNAVHVTISNIGSACMYIFMGAMHGKATKTNPLDLARALS